MVSSCSSNCIELSPKVYISEVNVLTVVHLSHCFNKLLFRYSLLIKYTKESITGTCGFDGTEYQQIWIIKYKWYCPFQFLGFL